MAPSEHDLREFTRRGVRARTMFASPEVPDVRSRLSRWCRALVSGPPLVLALTVAPSAADPVASSTASPPASRPDDVTAARRNQPERELTAADVREAPLPGQEGGQIEPDPGDSTLRV